MKCECLISEVALAHYVFQYTIQSFWRHLFRRVGEQIWLLVGTNSRKHTPLNNGGLFLEVICLIEGEKSGDGSPVNIFVVSLVLLSHCPYLSIIIIFVTWRWQI